MLSYSTQDYAEMLRGYLDSRRKLKPEYNSAAYRQGWAGGYKKQDRYQQRISRELVA